MPLSNQQLFSGGEGDEDMDDDEGGSNKEDDEDGSNKEDDEGGSKQNQIDVLKKVMEGRQDEKNDIHEGKEVNPLKKESSSLGRTVRGSEKSSSIEKMGSKIAGGAEKSLVGGIGEDV